MFRNWVLWTMLLTLTCSLVVGCAGCAPEGGKPGTVTEEGKK